MQHLFTSDSPDVKFALIYTRHVTIYQLLLYTGHV